jgi:citrate lyase subunit beta/citryl-CoA lyase
MKPLRSLLFVPGNKAAWMEKAPQYWADGLILKGTARTRVRQAIEFFAARGETLFVRVNVLEPISPATTSAPSSAPV